VCVGRRGTGALLSLNLAVFNALPLPGLDGWQLSVLALESARRKPLPAALKDSFNAIAALLFLLAFSKVVVSDVTAAGTPPLNGLDSTVTAADTTLALT
jgi:Zn-dependent protease